jgi:hypothetical protein
LPNQADKPGLTAASAEASGEQTPQPERIKYLQECEDLIKKLPSTFGELRAEVYKAEVDPPPLTLSREKGKRTKVYFPKSIESLPAESKNALFILLNCCKLSNYEAVETTRPLTDEFVKLLSGSYDNLMGVHFCMMAKENSLVPSDNVPKPNRRGWDFFLWYAFAHASKTKEDSQGYIIPRTTSMIAADKGQWHSGKIFTDLDRLNSLVRAFATDNATKLGPIRKFLRTKDYFTNKLVGKCPIAGLYTADELYLLKAEWTDRRNAVIHKYDSMPREFRGLLGTPIHKLLSTLDNGWSQDAKQIEETAKARVPNLLISTGSGKSAKKVIAKGQDLAEKLITADGGASVRTISKVLWSPLYQQGITQQLWTTSILRQTKDLNLREKNPFFTAVSNRVTDPKQTQSLDDTAIYMHITHMEAAVTTYLEVLPDKIGTQSWDATFGVATYK